MAQAAATLRQATFRRTGVLVHVGLVVAGALLIAGSAQIRIPLWFTPVPITGQTFGVLLVGAALGPWHGLSSGGLYLALGALGLPFYAGASGGWQHVQGATGGYLLSYAFAAWAVGALAERGWDKKIGTAILALFTGNVIIYLIGLPWLSWQLGTEPAKTLELGFYPFILGDSIKLLLAALALPGAWKLVERAKKDS